MKIDGADVFVIGITGTIGSGKSTAGKILTEMGVPVIDTDEIVHTLLDSDKEVKESIKQAFPQAVSLNPDGTVDQINRKQLAAIIFTDLTAKKKLESILHPLVRKICEKQEQEKANDKSKPGVIAVLIPLLFENKLQSTYDQTWTIVTDENLLKQRLIKRNGWTIEEINIRLAGQMSQEEKAKLADVVLDNSGDESQLRHKIANLIQNLPVNPKENLCQEL